MTTPNGSFADLFLPAPMLNAVNMMGFTTPTPVQEKTIPLALQGRDIISLAETGSGKTAAYLIPAITHVIANPKNLVLVLAPTRELAMQIGEVLRQLTRTFSQISSVTLIGGGNMHQQVMGLKRRPQFIVATPGRLMDHVRRRTADIRGTSVLILDEADRMLDMGFAPQVNQIVSFLSKTRQTMMFSATFPKEVRGLAGTILRNPAEIEVRKNEAPPIVIDQKVVDIDPSKKDDKTLDLINAATGAVLIFARTKRRTDRLTRYLEEYGVKVAKIHGDRSQAQRNKSIFDFRSGKIRVLVATDIAARGLDVLNISDVINYDLPMNADDYIHRIGRTGRAGQKGQALTLVSKHEREDWEYIARRVGLMARQERPGFDRPQRQQKNGKQERPQGERSHKQFRSAKNRNNKQWNKVAW